MVTQSSIAADAWNATDEDFLVAPLKDGPTDYGEPIITRARAPEKARARKQ